MLKKCQIISTRLRRGLRHIERGTIFQRLNWEVREWARRRRMAMWRRHRGKPGGRYFFVQPRVRMYLWFDSALSALIYNGEFEIEERRFLNHFLQAGDIFVDAGANIGLFTLIAASKISTTGQVYAFEPCLRTYNRLLVNLQLNQLMNVSHHRIALSDEEASVEMTISTDGYDAWNSLGRVPCGDSFSVEMVQSIRYDRFVREHNLVGRVALMKIDVEGWETHVLAGGQETLSRPDAPTLLVEFTEEVSEAAGSSCQELYRMLQLLGYEMFVYAAASNTLIPDPLRDSYPYLNLIATKEPRKVLDRLQCNVASSNTRRLP